MTHFGYNKHLPADEVSEIGRNTQGVRVMRLTDGKVQAVAITPRGEEESEEVDGEQAEPTEAQPTETQE